MDTIHLQPFSKVGLKGLYEEEETIKGPSPFISIEQSPLSVLPSNLEDTVVFNLVSYMLLKDPTILDSAWLLKKPYLCSFFLNTTEYVGDLNNKMLLKVYTKVLLRHKKTTANFNYSLLMTLKINLILALNHCFYFSKMNLTVIWKLLPPSSN